MTLEGVTRSMAHSIVEYRAAIGGFRRVEDLALVSGVGAARLQRFRGDVVVGDARRKSSRWGLVELIVGIQDRYLVKV